MNSLNEILVSLWLATSITSIGKNKKDRRYPSLISERVMNQAKYTNNSWILPCGSVKKAVRWFQGMIAGR
jgi:hypothetical protein